MGDGSVNGLRRASIVLIGLSLLMWLWPAASFAAGPLDLPPVEVDEVVEKATETVDQAADTVDQVPEAIGKVVDDTGSAVEEVVEDTTGAIDQAAGAVEEVVKDTTGAIDQAATDTAKQTAGGNTGVTTPGGGDLDGSSAGPAGKGSLQVRPGSSGDSKEAMVESRSKRRSGVGGRQPHRRSREQGAEERPGRPDNPLIELIEAGNEIGDQVATSAGQSSPPSTEEPTQGSGLPFTGGIALFVALAYASLFCGAGSTVLAGTKSKGHSEFRLSS